MNDQVAIPPDLGFLGCWNWDVKTDTVHTTGQLDQLFAVCPDFDGSSMSLYERSTHPNDIDWLRRERPRCFGPSGWGVVEYRVIDRDGVVHWVMCRALYKTDAEGAVATAQGMMFDVTAVRADNIGTRVAPAPLSNPLHLAADALMTAHEAAIQIGNHQLLFQVESALTVVGQALARNLNVVPQQDMLYS